MADLLARVRTAFDGVPYPKGISLCVGYDDEDINDLFGNCPWQSINPTDLACHSSALTFFTAEAFHYFLPSFMIAAIQHPTECSSVIDAITFSLTPPKMNPRRPSFWERWHLFSPNQRQVVVDFLSYIAADQPPSELNDVISCLRETINA